MNFVKKTACLLAVSILFGCGNYVPDQTHPPSASAHSDRRDCSIEADGGVAGEAVAVISPLAGMASLPGWWDRRDACMRARGWVKAEE